MNSLRPLLYRALPLGLFLGLGLIACGDNGGGGGGGPDARRNADAAGSPDADSCLACVASATCNAGACECPAGYEGDGTTAGTGCTDTNECTAAASPCVAGATCTNNDGGFACACPSGFTGDGAVSGTGCTDVDECATATDNCVDDAMGGACTNTPGAFTCACVVGFTGDGVAAGTACADVDECAAAAVCGTSDCINTTGAFRCEQTLGASPFRNVVLRHDRISLGAFDPMVTTGVLPNHVSVITGPSLGEIRGITAMKVHPTTGVVYGIIKLNAVPGRMLATLDPLSGEGPFGLDLTWTAIGIVTFDNAGSPTLPNIASLEFLPDGSLFAVSGDGGPAPESLFQIDPATGVATLVQILGNGADGETICWNPDDNHMYHWSGNGTLVMEKFPLANPPVTPLTITNIPIADFPSSGNETFGCLYVGRHLVAGVEQQVFRRYDLNSRVRYVTSTGVDVTTAMAMIPGFSHPGMPDDMRGIFAVPHQPYTVSPATDVVAGGATVTLTGGALAGATAVTFGGVAATITDATAATHLVVTAPAATAPGPVTIVATLASGVQVQWTGFSYVAPASRWVELMIPRAEVRAAMATGATTRAAAAPVAPIGVDPATVARRQAKGKL